MSADQPAAHEPNRVLELLWGLNAPPSRGPKPALSLPKIVDAAVRIADQDGLNAVSMRRVAEELGFTTMSLYRYVPSKDDLLELMMDAAAHPVPDASEMPEHWRDALNWWARASRAMVLRHPWFLDIPMSRPPIGPNNVRWMELGMRRLQGTGLEGGEMLGVLALISTYMLSEARLHRSMADAASKAGLSPEFWEHHYGEMLSRVINPAEFPTLAKAMQPDILAVPEDYPGDDLTFDLDIILDGVEVLIARRAAAAQSG